MNKNNFVSWNIRENANEANECLTTSLLPEFQAINKNTEKGIVPNIVFVDNITNSYPAFIAMCINYLLKKTN